MHPMNPHPIAKIFAPAVFGSLALLSVGFMFTPAQADEPEIAIEAPRAQPPVEAPVLPAFR